MERSELTVAEIEAAVRGDRIGAIISRRVYHCQASSSHHVCDLRWRLRFDQFVWDCVMFGSDVFVRSPPAVLVSRFDTANAS